MKWILSIIIDVLLFLMVVIAMLNFSVATPLYNNPNLPHVKIAEVTGTTGGAGVGNCPAGEVVMNTTAGGVECIAVAGGGEPSFLGNYSWILGLNTSNLSIYNWVADLNVSNVTANDRIDVLNASMQTPFNFSSGDMVVIAAFNSRNKSYANYVCDGFNDSQEINEAISSVINSSGGGTIVLLDGNFNISSPIYARSNITIAGQGIDATRIRLQNKSDCHMIQRSSAEARVHYFGVSGTSWDGNRAEQTSDIYSIFYNAEIWEVSFYRNKIGGAQTGLFTSSNGFTYSIIEKNIICTPSCTYGMRSWGNAKYQNNIFAGSNFDILGGGTFAVFSGNTFTSSNGAPHTNSETTSYNTFVGNLWNTGSVFLYTTSATVAYNTFVGNVFYGGNGISLTNSSNTVITGNSWLNGYNFVTLDKSNSNVISGNSIFNTYWYGIWLKGSSRNMITQNTISEVGAGANNTYNGIQLEPVNNINSTYNTIKDNIIKDTGGNSFRYGVYENDTSQNYNIIEGNIISGQLVSELGINGTYTKAKIYSDDVSFWIGVKQIFNYLISGVNVTGNINLTGELCNSTGECYTLEDLNTTGASGNPFDQSLNTTDNVTFYNISAENITVSGFVTSVWNITANWFLGLFNWKVNATDNSGTYLIFNGSDLGFNESRLNATLSSEGVRIGFNDTYNLTYAGYQTNVSINYTKQTVDKYNSSWAEPTKVYFTSIDIITTNITAYNATVLTMPLGVFRNYTLECVLFVNSSATTVGTQINISTPVNTKMFTGAWSYPTTLIAETYFFCNYAVNCIALGSAGVVVNALPARFSGRLETDDRPGNLVVAVKADAAGKVRVFVGSYCKLTEGGIQG